MNTALLQGCHQADRHFIIAADKRIGKGIFFPQPHLSDVDAITGSPGAADHLDVFLGDPVVPAGSHKAVKALAPLRAFVVHDPGQIDQALGFMLPDDVFGNRILSLLIIEIDKRTSRKLTSDGNGRDACFRDTCFHIMPGFTENNLIALNNYAVKLFQIRQAEDCVFASVLFIAQIFAETVENTDLHVRMILSILLQPVERLLHEFVIPVNGQECDTVQVLVCFHL